MAARTTWCCAGGILLAAVAFAAITRTDAILASHPAYLVTLIACALLGVLLLVVGLRSAPGRRGHLRIAGRIAGAIGTIAIAALLIWLRPFGATDPALRALGPERGVQVSESATRIVLRAAAPDAGATLVFIPGARVDPRAYAGLLRQVAAAGFPVVIVKPPYGIGLLARGAARDALERAAQGGRAVAVGGHSLGGTSAAMVTQARGVADGLLLWASFPADDTLADHADLTVASVSGTRDGLVTPADIADSRGDLPPDTRFTAVPGAVHADFGDYGEQRGDGDRAIPREQAQRAIVAATLRFMRETARASAR